MESEAAWEVFEAWWLDQGKTPEAPTIESLARFLEEQKAAGEPVKELRRFLDAMGRTLRCLSIAVRNRTTFAAKRGPSYSCFRAAAALTSLGATVA